VDRKNFPISDNALLFLAPKNKQKQKKQFAFLFLSFLPRLKVFPAIFLPPHFFVLLFS